MNLGTKFSILMLALMGSISMVNGSCISGWNCGTPQRYHHHQPRSLYGGNRHHGRRHRADAMDIVSEILSIPFYSNAAHNMMQHMLAGDETSALEASSFSPRYAISNSEGSPVAELSIELPGVPAKDISVEVEDGNVLRVRGSHTVRQHGYISSSEFDQSFTLDKDVDVDKISVTLMDGVLTVRAPKKERSIKRIPLEIQEKSLPSSPVVEEEVKSEGLAPESNDNEVHHVTASPEADIVVTDD